MRDSNGNPLPLDEQAKLILEAMTDEQFLAALEESCPEVIHGRGPMPADAMVPGPIISSSPSLEEAWHRERAKKKLSRQMKHPKTRGCVKSFITAQQVKSRKVLGLTIYRAVKHR